MRKPQLAYNTFYLVCFSPVVTGFPYEVNECGFAGFLMPIEVHFKNGEEPKKVIFQYDLFLNVPGQPPVNHIRVEKLTFDNPTGDLKRSLLQGGGVRTFMYMYIRQGKFLYTYQS